MDEEGLFIDFVGRDDDLRRVKRYSIFDTMMYRSNLYIHSHRTAALVRELNKCAVKVFGHSYDTVKAEILAFVHDDAEIIFGDIQAGNKSKMTTEQLEEVRQAEIKAIRKISQRFPKMVGSYRYESLLEEAENHQSLEAQVVSYADKFDALGEALHELYAGNESYITPITNEYGVIPVPTEYYKHYFETFTERFPDMKPLIACDAPIFTRVKDRDYGRVAREGSPHTKRSLRDLTGNA